MTEESRILAARIEEMKRLLRTRPPRELKPGHVRSLVHRLDVVHDRVRQRDTVDDADRRDVDAVAEELGDVRPGPQSVRHVSPEWAEGE